MNTDNRETTDHSTAIDVSNIKKTYESDEGTVVAVDDVSFSVDHGNIIGLLGPNGAGKTTTIKMILNLIEPTEGTVSIMGTDPQAQSQAIYQEVSAVLEGARNCYWQLTLLDNLHFFAGLRGDSLESQRAEVERTLSLLNLADRANEPIRNFSRGMKQKAALACALVQDPSILFLDEPTLGLDVNAERKLRDILSGLANDDRTVIISSHNMDLVQDICSRAIIMMDGRVVTNDKIQNLVHIFDADQYHLTVTGKLTSTLQTRLKRQYRAQEFTETTTGFECDVLLESERELYELMDQLREADLTVADIDSHNGNLEEAFVQAVTDQPQPQKQGVSR